jgi:Histidine kinase-like ATPase domain
VSLLESDGLKPAGGPEVGAEHRRMLLLCNTYPATAAFVAIARRAVVEAAADAGASGETLDAVRLAASEALTNVVMHAYDGHLGPTDDGLGFRPERQDPGLGLGLALIAEVSDQLSIGPGKAGGIEIRMGFELPSAPCQGSCGS